VKVRYTWISPIAFSAQAPFALYAGAQQLYRSFDQGHEWKAISPDLTGRREDARRCDGDVPIERATACGYGVIYSVAPSPLDHDEIWIGTDNGRVQLTRDGGQRWKDITPKGVPDWASIATLARRPCSTVTRSPQCSAMPRRSRRRARGSSRATIVSC